MSFVNGKTYRFINSYYDTHALNVYGTNAASTGRNICLYKDDDTDVMQDWVVKKNGSGYRLHSAVNESFVLDCSDGSLSNSYKNNAHLCATSQTSTTDSCVEFEYVDDNVYKIYLPGKNLYLTATNTTLVNGLPASSISNATALKGGTGGQSNVYWAAESSSAKQEWIVSPEVDGGSKPDPNPDPEAKMTLAQLKNKFPEGKYWNHVSMSGNNQDSYTNSPCPTHANNNTDTCNAFALNGVTYSWQCMGFAEKCGYDFSGSNPRLNGEWTTYENVSALDNLKPGDIVRYFTNRASDIRHSILVTGVSGDTVTFGDCNADNKCGIRWNATISRKTLRSEFVHLRSAPFTLV